MDKCTAIVLSGGNGSRMKSDIPKQYLQILGKPILFYSLNAFEKSSVDEIIIVASDEYIDFCRNEIVEKYDISKVTKIVPGGAQRYLSVYEGLKAAEGSKYVLVHDGARPLIEPDVINASIDTVKKHLACVVGMPLKDTIKKIGKNGFVEDTPERKLYWQVQTPQSFSYEILMNAYANLFKDIEEGKAVPTITDDAMIVEYSNAAKIKIIEGEYSNIKVTTPEDMVICEALLKAMNI